jgi:hypothetical protein
MITPKIIDVRVDIKDHMETKQEVGMTITTTMAEMIVVDDLDLIPDVVENDMWTREQNQ